MLDELRLPEAPTLLDRAELVSALGALEASLDEATESAFVAGLVDLVGPLEEARSEVERSAAIAAVADEDLVRSWNAGQHDLLGLSRRALADLREAARSDAPTPENLPRELRQRFFTRSGNPLGFLIPAGSVFDPIR